LLLLLLLSLLLLLLLIMMGMTMGMMMGMRMGYARMRGTWFLKHIVGAKPDVQYCPSSD
jgi:glycerol uptake facilitator-like aquaporin